MNSSHEKKPVVVLGAGPAGLTAAKLLVDRGIRVELIEKTTMVGGIARTDEYKGNRFDLGGHRFFTRVGWVMDFWRDVMGDDFLTRPRLSHIYYKGTFFSYPIKPLNVLKNLGIVESVRCGASYCWARLFPRKKEESFEDYVVNHFGERLFRHFFKAYTEKVWGIPTSEIRAAWAAQRIKGMTITGILKSWLTPSRNKFVSLIEQFYYPRLGPGQLWERVRDQLLDSGLVTLSYETEPVAITRTQDMVSAVRVRGPEGERTIDCRAAFSTIPVRELVPLVSPPLAENVRSAARDLKYRDFLVVALIVRQREMFPDTWIYVHDPNVHVGRIQNFKNWSPELVADPTTTCLGLEYFLNEGDELWNMSDEKLVALAADELARIGLCDRTDVVDGTVVRVPKAYPVYDARYEEAMPAIVDGLSTMTNLYPIGRNGMHKYNNQDHSMETARLSVENMLGAKHDVWNVNVDRVYHEEVKKQDAAQVTDRNNG